MADYRCYILRNSGEWLALADITSATEDEAIRQALELSDDQAFDLWQDDRLIYRRDLPIAEQSAAPVSSQTG